MSYKPLDILTERFKSALAELKHKATEDNKQHGKADVPQESLYLFVSFDLCNSTKFKSIHTCQWPTTLNRFYDRIREIIGSGSYPLQVWKYVGDEVLFFKELNKKDKLREAVSHIYKGLEEIVKDIGEFCDKAKDILSVKATAWCAMVAPMPSEMVAERREPGSYDTPNIANYKLMHLRDSHQSPSTDFAGPDIDLGFRLSKHTYAKRLLVSGELASLTCGEEFNNAENSRFKIVDYESLKGIWNDRRYPIVWYEKSWDSEAIKQSFAYDDEYCCEHVKNILNNKIFDIEKLPGVYNAVNRQNAIEHMRKRKEETPANGINEKVLPRTYTENHFVAVCLSSDGERVLCAQRNADKPLFPNKWEFGCGQPVNAIENYEQCLVKAYKDDFMADIELAKQDETYPYPLTTFGFSKNNHLIFGLRVLAILKSDEAALTAKNHECVLMKPIEEALKMTKKILRRGLPCCPATCQRHVGKK